MSSLFVDIGLFAAGALILATIVSLVLHAALAIGLRAALNRLVLRQWMLKAVDRQMRGSESKYLVTTMLPALSPLDPDSLLTLTPAQLCGQISERLQLESAEPSSSRSEETARSTALPIRADDNSLLALFAPLSLSTMEAQRNLDSLQARLTARWALFTYALAWPIGLLLLLLFDLSAYEIAGPPTSAGTADLGSGSVAPRIGLLGFALALVAALLVPVLQRIATRLFPAEG